MEPLWDSGLVIAGRRDYESKYDDLGQGTSLAQTCTWEASEVVDGPEVREGGAGWQEVTQAAGMSCLFVRSPV